MKLAWLIEAEVNEAHAGHITRELQAFTERLVRFHTAGAPVVSTWLIGAEQVVVDAEALLDLQTKAGLET